MTSLASSLAAPSPLGVEVALVHQLQDHRADHRLGVRPHPEVVEHAHRIVLSDTRVPNACAHAS
jgi:hypothetical protein